jgi:hypothetical protein
VLSEPEANTSSPERQYLHAPISQEFFDGSHRAIAIQVYRPSLGRWVVVGKVAGVDGETVLAVTYRHRQRLQNRVSLPLVAIRYGIEHGAQAVIVRYDDERVALRLPIEDALRHGWREALDGQVEVWLPLSLFEEGDWVDWPYATAAVRLGPGPGELPRQLALLGEAAR